MEIFQVVFVLCLIKTSLGIKEKECSEEPDGGFIYYFAYGSNMLPATMHVISKTAKNVSSAKLENYRLDFTMTTQRWNGAEATIVFNNDYHVWGNVWQISIFEVSKIDEQDGEVYYAKEVEVKLACGLTVPARVYIGRYPPPSEVSPETLPLERQPSKTYHQVLLLGALQSHLPASYLNYLLRFPNNGQLAPSSTRRALGYPFYDESLP